VREAEQVVDWILILFRWLIAMPDRAARVLETGRTIVTDMAAARWEWREFERGPLARKPLHVFIIRWMTYCLGQGWTNAPPGLLPVFASRAPSGGVPRDVFCGVPGFILNDHFLSCSERLRGFTAPALGALAYSTDFSMPAYAADF